LQWENEGEEPEETHLDHQEEADCQEEEAQPPEEEQQHNQSRQQPTSKPWAKILPSSKERGRKRTPS